MIINLKEYKGRQEVADLLAECMYPDEELVVRELEQYNCDPSRILLGKIENQTLAGLMGFVLLLDNEAELKHIAIKPEKRQQGLGRLFVMEAFEEYPFKKVYAETDKDAVDFYRTIGFRITSLGEKYPGVERFECVWIRNQ